MKKSAHHPPGYDFDTHEMAAYMCVSAKTLDQWAWRKMNLPYVLIGGKRWYRKSDGDHYLSKREVKVAPPKQVGAAA